MILKDKLKRLFKGSFIRNVGILAGGTAFSQLLSLLALPLLTRIYTPEDFTVLSTYTAILSLITVIACLRFEIAIPIPIDDDSAVNLLVISIISVIGITFLSCMVIVFLADWINSLTGQRIKEYLWLIPLGVLFGGLYNSFQYWMTRNKNFTLIARTRMSQSVIGVTSQIGFGYIGVSPLGLLLGQLFNISTGVFGLIFHFFKELRKNHLKITLISLKNTFVQYDRFPKYSTWEALTNSAGIQIPILLIATMILGAEAGFLMLAMRLLSAPMGLIGGSIAQVYLSEAAAKYNQGELNSFTKKIILTLVKMSLIPMLIIAITAPFVTPFLFGEIWYRTGVLIAWMVPWFFMQFITSPVSMSLHITNNQRIAMFLQFLGLLLRGGLVFLAVKYFNNWVGEVYAISGFVFYMIYLVVVLTIISKK